MRRLFFPLSVAGPVLPVTVSCVCAWLGEEWGMGQGGECEQLLGFKLYL